jgi:dolichol-phosphate mannosyltransferase
MNLLSLVIPVYNEGQILEEFYGRLKPALAALGVPAEIILVDDGSTDATARIARGLCEQDRAVRLIMLSRNFGQQSAISAGLRHAAGEAVVVMDADLQDPPEIIGQLLETHKQGFDIVYAVRRSRAEPLLKQVIAKLFYRLIRWLAVVRIPVDAGDFCLMGRRAVDQLNALPESNRYVRGLRAWIGYAQAGIAFERGRRCGGMTKFTLWKMFQVGLDAVVAFARLPFQLLLVLGALLMAAAGVWLLGLVLVGAAERLLKVLMAGLLFFNGLQLAVLGLLGEVVWHISQEVKGRPDYIIKETVGFEHAPGQPSGCRA